MPVPKIYLKAPSRQHLENHYACEQHMQLCLLLSDPLCKAKIFPDCLFYFWVTHMYWGMGRRRLCICLIGKHC